MGNSADNQVVLFGQTNFRNKKVTFGIKMDDRRRHMYVIGKTGMGKSELLKNIAIQDIQDGRGLAFVDPHGDPVEDLFDYIPQERIKDVIYINPADMEFPVSFNVMEHVGFDQRHLVADGMMAVFKKIWVDQWSARMEYILNNTILALLESPGSTILGVNRMLADKDYRREVVSQVTDPEVKAFWTQEFAKYNDRYAQEATAAIQNKIGQFISNALIRNIVGQPKSSFDMRTIMDEGKILLVNISKGRIGEDASRLLGALIITKIQLAAMSRVDIPERERNDFVLIVDEFQNFATASFANILSEARKYHLSLVVAHQYVAQMDEGVRDAVFGNVGTIVTFRVGAEDAEMLEKELAPEFLATDIVNLGKRQIYLKLMIDGVASRAFSAMTMDTIARLPVSFRNQIIDFSRQKYAATREQVEQSIADWHIPSPEPERQERFDNRQFSENRPMRNDMQQRPRQMPRPFGAQVQMRQAPHDVEAIRPARQAPGSFTPSAPRPQQAAPVRPSQSQPQTNTVRPGEENIGRPVFKPLSLSEALNRGPVDFRGNPIKPKHPIQKQKVDVDVGGLRKILEESMDDDE